MDKYILNIDKSKEVYSKCKKRLAAKECYNNVFRVATDYITNFKTKKWRIAYGYMTVLDNLLCRHCFIIDENNTVIDPTIILINRTDAEYYTMKIFDDWCEYFKAIKKEQYLPALYRYLNEYNKIALNWAEENQYVLIG